MRRRNGRLALGTTALGLALALAAPATAGSGVAASQAGGLGWRDATVGMAILLGVIALGLWGDVVVGALIAGVGAVVAAGAAIVARVRSHGDRPAVARPHSPRALRPAAGQERR